MDNLENVVDLASLWNDFDESYDDRIRKQLQHVTEELAKARKEASEQAKINKEYVKKLIYLLGIAYKERDEAKAQLRTLLMVKPPPTLSPSSLPPLPPPPTTTTMPNATDKIGLKGNTTFPTNPQQQPIPVSINPTWDLRSSEATTHPTMSPTSPLMMMNNNVDLPLTMPNSGMTSHLNTPSSSPDSYFDVGSSPESYNMLSNPNCASSSYDATCTLVDNMLAEARPQPKRGKLLQSVMEAGPQLDSLQVGGSLPESMNPPQVMHASRVPPAPVPNESLDH